MKYIIGGKLNAAVFAAKKLKSLGIEFLICPSKGEDRIKGMTYLKDFAQENSIEILDGLEKLKGEKLFFLSVEYDRIINPALYRDSSLFFNVHFSLLPQYRGTMTSFWPILFRENSTGVTIHLIDNGIDTGDIIFQRRFPIPEDFTCRDLYFEYHKQACKLLDDSMESMLNGNYLLKKQKNSLASSFPRFLYTNIPKQFTLYQLKLMEYNDAYNLLRALIFEEFQLPTVDGKKISKISRENFKGSNYRINLNDGIIYANII